MKKEKLYRVINTNGKRWLYKKIDHIDNYRGKYDLDDPSNHFYIDTIESYDVFCSDNELMTYFYMDDRNKVSSYSPIYIENDIMKQPLQIFSDFSLLQDKKLCFKLIEEYPNLLYTLFKKQYCIYFSLIEIVYLIKKHKIYPVENLYPELFFKLLPQKENEEYGYQFLKEYLYYISTFIFYIRTKRDRILDDDDEFYSDEDSKFFLNYSPYIFPLLKDERLINDIFNDSRFSITMVETIEYIIYSSYDEDNSCNNKNYYDLLMKKMDNHLNQMKSKLLEEEYKEKCLLQKYQLELEGLVYEKSKDYNQIIKNFLKCIYIQKKHKKKYETYSIKDYLKCIPDTYFEDKQFLITAAKYGLVFSLYSQKYKNDFEILYEEVKHNKWLLNKIDSSIFNVPEYIIKLSYLYPNILLYTSEDLLNDYSFMIEYLSIFPINNFFRIGKKLSRNPYFFESAKFYEPNILMYCDPELYSNEIFMKRMLYRDPRWYGLLDDSLKKQINYSGDCEMDYQKYIVEEIVYEKEKMNEQLEDFNI